MLLNTQYIVLIIAWLRPVQTGFLQSTNILLRGKTETDEIPNPHEPRPAVRSFPVRSSLVSGFFPVHRTGPRNTSLNKYDICLINIRLSSTGHREPLPQTNH